MKRILAILLISCFLLGGCYTQLKVTGGSGVERHYSRGCYYQEQHVALEIGVVKRYRRVCPGDAIYSRQRYYDSFYYRKHYDYSYFDAPADHIVPEQKTSVNYRPRTIGRSPDERGKDRGTTRRDRNREKDSSNDRQRDRGNGEREQH